MTPDPTAANRPARRRLRVDVWSDIACPWCYIGKRRLERALASFPHRGEVDVVFRAFELDPNAPRESERVPYAERLARKYGTSPAEAQAMIDRIVAVARADGIVLDFDRIRPGNTFDAHRLVHFAATCGIQGAVKERFLRAYFSEGEPIGDHDTLLRLAREAGLDPDEARAVLANGRYAEEVRADEARAAARGVRGVPFFLIGDKVGISGAQEPAVLEAALMRAWEELA